MKRESPHTMTDQAAVSESTTPKLVLTVRCANEIA